MHDRSVQPSTSQPPPEAALNTPEARGGSTNQEQLEANHDVPAGIQQGPYQPGFHPPPGWMGWYGGHGHGPFGHRRRARAMMMFGGSGMGGGPPQCPGVGPADNGRGVFNPRRYWNDMVFGEDEEVRSVSGHMEDCNLEDECRNGSDDEGSHSSSSSSSSNSSSSSSSSSSESENDDERTSRKKKSKGKRKQKDKKGRKHKHGMSQRGAGRDDDGKQGTPDQRENTAQPDQEGEGLEARCDRGHRNKRHHKHRHGNHSHHHRDHGRHQPPPFVDPMMMMMMPPPPPPGFFDGPPPFPPMHHPLGPPPHHDVHGTHNAYLNGCSKRSKKLRKTAKKWRKANMKAWKLRAKMERQCRRFSDQGDGGDVAGLVEGEGDVGMLPPWVFFAPQFRRHHRGSGGRRRFCCCENGRDGHRMRDGKCRAGRPRNGADEEDNGAGAAQGALPQHDAANGGVVGDQTPMDDVEVAQEASPEKDAVPN